MSANKKGSKSKKATDPSETGKLLAAKINQLESDAAGEKDQEAEIGMLDSCQIDQNHCSWMPKSLYKVQSS